MLMGLRVFISADIEGVAGAVSRQQVTLGELSRRGHLLNLDNALIGGRPFGGAQMVYSIDDGFIGATDPRKDGIAAGY